MSLSRTFINNYKFCLTRLVANAPTILNPRHMYPSVYQTRNVHRKSIYKHEEAKKLRFYFLTRYVEYLKNYDKVIEKNFPATMQTYRVFKEGFNSFLSDTKYYFKIVGLLYTPGYNFRKLLRREIELYDQMPKDMRKVLPILILTPLPFGFYVVLPLIYTFPKYLLSSHFWTLQQKSTFNIEYLRNRLVHNKPVFRYLQSQLDYLKGSDLHKPWSKVLGKLGSGSHPTVDEILNCKELFTALPYNLHYLSRNHVNIQVRLEEQYPEPFSKYRAFTHGFYNFYIDTKKYFIVKKILKNSNYNFKLLRRTEIELYHQFPKDALKVAPTLFFASLPIVFYFVMPIVVAFPRQTVSPHFWTKSQKAEFSIHYLRQRLMHNQPVLDHLLECSQKDCFKTKRVYNSWMEMIENISAKTYKPPIEEVLRYKEVFLEKPYGLCCLSDNYIKHLIKMHDLHSGWFRRARLAERARILVEMDRAIMREGGVHNLPIEALRNACYIRGLNPTNMKTDDMIQWLTNWIQISCHIDKDNASLLLHCPVLLAYNEPSNWRLIYPAKDPS